MSQRAYKLIEIKKEDQPTFNFTHEFWLDSLSHIESTDFLEFDRQVIETAIKEEEDQHKQTILKSILKEMDDNKDDYITYYLV